MPATERRRERESSVFHTSVEVVLTVEKRCKVDNIFVEKHFSGETWRGINFVRTFFLLLKKPLYTRGDIARQEVTQRHIYANIFPLRLTFVLAKNLTKERKRRLCATWRKSGRNLRAIIHGDKSGKIGLANLRRNENE